MKAKTTTYSEVFEIANKLKELGIKAHYLYFSNREGAKPDDKVVIVTNEEIPTYFDFVPIDN